MNVTLDIMDRKILVIDTIGRQAKAFIDSLQSTSEIPSDFKIILLLQHSSSSATTLGTHTNVKYLKGDLDNPETIRKVFDGEGGKTCIWGMFVVRSSNRSKKDATEEEQGIMLANLALEYEVVHFVYSSIDRSGEVESDRTRRNMSDRIAKDEVEGHIKALGKEGLNWTIVRPVLFMEDLEGTWGRIVLMVLRCSLKPDTRLKMIGLNNIGRFIATVFSSPERCTRKVFVPIADILTVSEIYAVHKRITRRLYIPIPALVGRLLLVMNKSLKELLEGCEQTHNTHISDPGGLEVDLKDARGLLPDMASYESFLQETRLRHGGRKPNRNWVPLGRLISAGC